MKKRAGKNGSGTGAHGKGKHRRNSVHPGRPGRSGASNKAARLGAMLLTGSFAIAQVPVYAAGALPVACPGSGPSCIGGTGKALGFDPLGTHSTITAINNGLVIHQSGNSAIFNWASFNISAGNTVQFIQPSSSSVALNRIFDPNVTTISGNLKANGQIYLVNPNGILFGSGANVNVGGLIASTSNIKDDRITAGLLSDATAGAGYSQLVFTNNSAALGTSVADSPVAGVGAGANPAIVVQNGATLYAAGRDTNGTVVSAGRIFLFAPTIENGGTIKVDGGGQVILGAGSDVYLGSSTDISLRGLLVELNGSSAAGVKIDASGNIAVARGNITLMGLAVQQAGTLSATSALDENGSIRLIARQTSQANANAALDKVDPGVLIRAAETGKVTIASGSHTTVSLDPTDTATAPLNDATAAATRSTIEIQGAQVSIGGSGAAGSTVIQAHGGDVTVTARAATSGAYTLGDSSLLGNSNLNDPTGNGNITVGADALIDVSGLLNVAVNGGREFVYVTRLTSTNLANAPYQRTGFLLGKGVWVDLAKVPSWLNLASLQQAVAGTQAERDAAGGTVALRAEGTVTLAKGSVVNVSGGSTYLTPAEGRTSQLLTASGAVVDISNATADTQYVGFADQSSYNATDIREGVNFTQSWQTPTLTQSGGYTLGSNAGKVEIYASAATLGGTLLAHTSPSLQQRNNLPQGGLLQIGVDNLVNLDQEAGVQRANILLGGSAAQLAKGFDPALAPAVSGPTIDVNTTSLQQSGFTRLNLLSDGAIEVAPGSALNLGPGGSFAARGNAVFVESSITAPGGSVTLSQRPLTPIPGSTNTTDELNYRNNLSLVLNTSPLFDAVDIKTVSGAATTISTAGLWTNDALLPATTVPSAPVALNGGSGSPAGISVSGATVDVSTADFDVSAGAWLTQNGLFTGGSAGSLSISALPSTPALDTPPTAPAMVLGSNFASRIAGFGASKGGSLSLASWSLQLGAKSGTAGPAAVVIDPAVAQRGFQSFAFNGYELAAVSPGTIFAPQPLFFQNNPTLRFQASAASLLGVDAPRALLPGKTAPASISLTSNDAFPSGIAGAPNPNGGSVLIGQGAVLDAGAQGSVSLNAYSEILVDGTVRANAGSVAMSLSNPDQSGPTFLLGNLNSRSVQLGPDAVVDVSGISLVTTGATGLRSGSVLDAGSVALSAPLGTVAADPGSRILLGGTHDVIDVVQGTQVQPLSIASAGGSLSVSAGNGVYLEGSVAASGGSAGANGGNLSVALQATAPDTSGSILDPGVPVQIGGPENLIVTDLPVAGAPALSFNQQNFTPPVVSDGKGNLVQSAGQGVVGSTLINRSGFENVWLQSPDTITLGQARESLALGRAASGAAPYSLNALFLSSQALDVGQGASVALNAGYLALGQIAALSGKTSNLSNAAAAATGSSGTGVLTAQARGIDLVGDLALQGVAQTTLTAMGDVRTIGIAAAPGETHATRSIGTLSFGGNLSVDAAQLYPTTQTDYAINAADAGAGQFVMGRSGAAALAPLTAGGALSFNVTGFTSSGTVEAPLGALNLTASTITLLPGSTLSVTGSSALVPYGNVINGTTWTYDFFPANYGAGITVPIDTFTLGSTTKGTFLPAKSIALNAPTGSLDVRHGAVISAAGGGNVLGTDFVAGPGGSYDVSINFPYGNTVRNPYFALIPSRGTSTVPYDTQVYTDLVLNGGLPTSVAGNGQFAIGQTLTVAAGSGIPAGTYTVMPARYALLPGAYAVEAVSGYQNIAPGASVPLPDGTSIVAGKLGFANAGTVASQWSGYRVYSSSQFHTLAELDSYYGSQFFATAASDVGQAAQRLAQDAGSVQIAAQAISLAGTLDVAPLTGARGVELAIDAPQITVADNPAAAGTPQSNLQLGAAELSKLGAETVILGAIDTGSGTTVALSNPVPNQSVTLQQSATPSSVLSAGQVILASSNVTLAAGASVAATTTQSPSTTAITVSGDGAGLYVGNTASAPIWTHSPQGTGTTGNLTVQQGASISGNSVIFDATAAQNYADSFHLAAKNLDLSTTVLNLGLTPAVLANLGSVPAGLNLTPALLGIFSSARNLRLATQGGVNVYGNATIGATSASGVPTSDNLDIVGPGIAGVNADGGASDSLTLNAGHITLDNSAQLSLANPLTPNQPGAAPLALHINARATAADDGSVSVIGARPLVAPQQGSPLLTFEGFGTVAINATGRTNAAGATVSGTGDLVFGGPANANAGIVLAPAAAGAAAPSLAVDATRITAQRGVNASITVPGALSIAASGPAPATPQNRELGASLSITAQSVDLAGRIDLPAGVVQIATTGTPPAGGAAPAVDLTLESGSSIRVAGLTQAFASTTADVSAGAITLSSANGSIVQDAGATLDLSGAGVQGDAGSLDIAAPTGTVTLGGTVLAAAGSGARGAHFGVDASSVSNLSALAQTFNTAVGSTRASSIDVRARSGNLAVNSGDLLRAASIVLEADGATNPDGSKVATDGSISVAGTLDASGANGGRIALYANDQVLVQGGALLDAHATAAGGQGGAVTISSRIVAAPATSLDAIVLQSGSHINAAGGAGGTGGSVTLRAPRVGGDVAITAAAGTVSGTRALDGTIALNAGQGVQAAVIVDAVKVYSETGPVTLDPGASGGLLASLQSDSQAYMTSALGFTPGTGVDRSRLALDLNLRPESQIDTSGAITVSYAKKTAPLLPVLDFAAVDGSGAYLWRYGGSTLATSTPGALTLRAGGGVNINTSISDGFNATAPGATVPTATKPFVLNGTVATSGESWSYTMTAGADLSAANPNQVLSGAANPGANLTIGTQSAALPVTVRTGTGSITLNASQDIVLANGTNQQANVVYTAGVANVIPVDGTGKPISFLPDISYQGPTATKTILPVTLTQYGGDLTINAARDVLGTAFTVDPLGSSTGARGSSQAVSDWLLRGGRGTAAEPTVWWVDFANFQQGFGALGGGNLSLTAGRNAEQVDAVATSSGYNAGAGPTVQGHGTLDLSAGQYVVQGLYYAENGAMTLRATTFESDPTGSTAGSPVADVRLAQGPNSIDLQARESAQFQPSFNPTVAPISVLETGSTATDIRLTNSLPPGTSEYLSQFLTMNGSSSFDARATAGDLVLANANNVVTVPSLQLVSFGGSVDGVNLSFIGSPAFPGGVVLLPSATGQLRVLADNAINGLSVFMSQADPAGLPGSGQPTPAGSGLNVTSPNYLASGAGGTSLHADDPAVAELVARNGTIMGDSFEIPKTAEVAAGGDLGSDALFLQNSNAQSLSTVSSGGSIIFNGIGTSDGITIGGPGALQVIAAGAINLGSTGTGITSTGNLNNGNLNAEGATLVVVAGAGRGADGFAALPDYAGAITRFVQYDAFASAGSAAAGLDQQAVAALAKNPDLAPLVKLLTAALANRSSATDPNSSFSKGLAALTPEQLATGATKLASSIQVVNNQIFVNSNNSETFAPAYIAFADLFPAANSNDAAVRQFVLNNVFANSPDPSGLRAQALQGLPASLAHVINLGLAAPGSVNNANSAFSQALAALDPAVLQSGVRQLYSQVFTVAGNSERALAAAGQLTGNGSPYAKELSAFAAALSSTAPQGTKDLDMDYSEIKVQQTGNATFFAPQGAVVVGQSSPPVLAVTKTPDNLGIFTYGGGDIIGMARDSINVFQSRVFTVAGGDIDLWSSLANLDAGKGPRDVAVVPPPRLVLAANGLEQLDVSSTVTGSGIGALQTSPTQPPSNINLMAPAGYVDAGEAGIRADTGKVTLGTNLVLNAGNISAASGVSGGAVVASPPPPAPPSTGSSAGDRVVEEAQREALAQAQAAAGVLNNRPMSIVGEFIGFDDCVDSERTTGESREDCVAARGKPGSKVN